jgi:hypothetical protein
MNKYVYFLTAVFLLASCSHTDPAIKYPNIIADIDPYPVGTISASREKAFSSQITGTTIDVIFYPRENAVALEFYAGTAQYRQIWNEAGRQCFIDALSRYKEDFENKNLVNKNNKTRSKYGKLKGQFQWKPLKFSSTYRSAPAIELGYCFKDNTPYFSIYQRKADELSCSNKEGITESPSFPLFFTRAQGEELAQLFNQTFLLESLTGKESQNKSEVTRDEY